jgi:hypothetical protein
VALLYKISNVFKPKSQKTSRIVKLLIQTTLQIALSAFMAIIQLDQLALLYLLCVMDLMFKLELVSNVFMV